MEPLLHKTLANFLLEKRHDLTHWASDKMIEYAKQYWWGKFCSEAEWAYNECMHNLSSVKSGKTHKGFKGKV